VVNTVHEEKHKSKLNGIVGSSFCCCESQLIHWKYF